MEKLINKNGQIINESKLSRVWSHFNDKDKAVAIISAFRGNYTFEENIKRNKSLAYKIRTNKFGFIWLEGFWTEEMGTPEERKVAEHSILIIADKKHNDLLKQKIQEWMKEYEQESVIFKPSEDIKIYELKKDGTEINKGAFHPDKIAEMYSKLMKGDRRTFTIEHAYISPNWFDRLSIEKTILEKIYLK